MGFFDFFKKEKKITEITPVRIDELNNIIFKINQDLRLTEKNAVNSLLNAKTLLVQELKVSLSDIQKVDVQEKKAEEKFKLVVKDNLERYLVHLQNLIIDLEKLNSEDLRRVISDISRLLHEFEKKSFINFVISAAHQSLQLHKVSRFG